MYVNSQYVKKDTRLSLTLKYVRTYVRTANNKNWVWVGLGTKLTYYLDSSFLPMLSEFESLMRSGVMSPGFMLW